MNVRLLKLHDKYMRHQLAQNANFAKIVVDERISGNQWTLHLSYTDQNHARVEDHFDIQVIDHGPHPHVICGLTRFIHNGGSRDDTREALFKPGKWLGPDLVVNPIQQQSESPRLSPTRSLERSLLTTSSATQISREDLRADPRSQSTITQPKVASKPDHPTTQASVGSKIVKRENCVEHRILTIARAFVKGTQILVRKPKDSPRKRLETVRRCLHKTVENNTSCQNVSLLDMWEELRERKVPVDNVYPETCSYVNNIQNELSSTKNVGTYITGVRKFYALDKRDNPPCEVRKKRGMNPLALAFERIMKLIKTLTAYYEGDTDIAISIFTFLEVGGFGFTKLGCAAQGTEDVLHDGIIALVDLILRRLAAESTDTGEETIPLLNPVAFQWWYERNTFSYENMCQRFDLLALSSAAPEMLVERPVTTILDKIRQRSRSVTGHAEHEINNDVEDTDHTTEVDCSDESKNLLLQIAPRLARYMTPQDKDTYVNSFKGDDEEQENMRLALSILNGETLNDEVLSASLDVAYAIVDILLYSPPKEQRKSQPGVKRRRLEPEADRDTRIDVSEAENSCPEQSLPPVLLENNVDHQHVPPEKDQIISENQRLIGLGEWAGNNFTRGMDYDFLMNQTFGSAGTSNDFGDIADPSQFDSQFVQSTYPGNTDVGGMDASDGLQLFSSEDFPNNWSSLADIGTGEFS